MREIPTAMFQQNPVRYVRRDIWDWGIEEPFVRNAYLNSDDNRTNL